MAEEVVAEAKKKGYSCLGVLGAQYLMEVLLIHQKHFQLVFVM